VKIVRIGWSGIAVGRLERAKIVLADELAAAAFIARIELAVARARHATAEWRRPRAIVDRVLVSTAAGLTPRIERIRDPDDFSKRRSPAHRAHSALAAAGTAPASRRWRRRRPAEACTPASVRLRRRSARRGRGSSSALVAAPLHVGRPGWICQPLNPCRRTRRPCESAWLMRAAGLASATAGSRLLGVRCPRAPRNEIHVGDAASCGGPSAEPHRCQARRTWNRLAKSPRATIDRRIAERAADFGRSNAIPSRPRPRKDLAKNTRTDHVTVRTCRRAARSTAIDPGARRYRGSSGAQRNATDASSSPASSSSTSSSSASSRRLVFVRFVFVRFVAVAIPLLQTQEAPSSARRDPRRPAANVDADHECRIAAEAASHRRSPAAPRQAHAGGIGEAQRALRVVRPDVAGSRRAARPPSTPRGRSPRAACGELGPDPARSLPVSHRTRRRLRKRFRKQLDGSRLPADSSSVPAIPRSHRG